MSQDSHDNSADSQRISFISQPGSSTELTELTNAPSLLTQEELESPSPPNRGWVNQHYKKTLVGTRKMRQCIVEGCNKQYSAGSSTRVFKDHWLKEHGVSPTARKTLFMFHDELHTNRLVKLVLSCHLGYNLVDQEDFKKFTSSLNSNKQIICRQTLANIVNRNRVHLTSKICNKLEFAESVALTFDIWSVRKGARGFGCVTAHYVSLEGRMENLILHFKRMKFPHDAETIRSFIQKPIDIYNLKGKVAAITTDNASNNIAAIKMMDESTGLTSVNFGLIHYKCIAHIFDLGMKAALKELRDTIRPVREAVMAIRSSGKRKEKFLELQRQMIAVGEQLTADTMELAEDVDHRWNSAFTLLERAHALRKAVDQMLSSTKGLELIESIDWTAINEVIRFLRPFDEATKRLCSGDDVTISLVSCIAPQLVNHCANYESSSNQTIASAANSIRTKLTDYELNMYHPVVDLAYFLDPRFKTVNMSDHHRRIVMDRLRKLLDTIPAEEQSSSERENSSFFQDFEVDDHGDELNSYLDGRRVKMGTNVVVWWRNNSDTYPNLSRIARLLLPIQATSVASERVFSVAGDVDTKQRNRLSDESVENIVLFKSWMQFLNYE